MKKRVLFIDRDGTVIVEPCGMQQVDSIERLAFIPGAIGALSSIARHTDYELVMVTNQDALGTPSFPEERFWPLHNAMIRTLAGEGVVFDQVLINRSFEPEGRDTRKTGIGMLTRYLLDEYDMANSFMIGDRVADLELADTLGAQALYFSDETQPQALLTTTSWREVEDFLIAQMYTAQVSRTTTETKIELSVALYGAGKISIDTGLGFFDHMLVLLATHAGFDLKLTAEGDLHVDEHHLIEDVGIVLGEALRSALGSKSGLARYGFLLPMDEALAQIALDLSGRSELVWNAHFRRERLGNVATEMLKHFFRSLCDACKCTLHVTVQGENEHHKAEAIFKGVGRALRAALMRDARVRTVPSTKGVL